jgi:hypothetical protein
MIVKVDCSMERQLEAFLEYVKARVNDPAHKPNANVIADFIDKFLVVELKRLNTHDESYQEEIEFPEELILQPLMEAKAKMDGIFNDFLKSKGGAPVVTPPTTPVADPVATTPVAQSGKGRSFSAPVTTTKRNGNGHKSAKVRDLLDGEKDHIRSCFQGCNGQIAEDKCVDMKQHTQIGTEISIFQVTGFVTYLHKEIAMGKSSVGDMDAYLKFLQGHRSLWSTWNSPKYQAMRAAAAAATVAANAIPSSGPRFTSFPKR